MKKMKETEIEWIGCIPFNWNLVKYKRYCEVFAGGTPDTGRQEYYDGDIPWIQSGKIQNCDIEDCSRYITKLGVENSSTKFIPKNTSLLAMTGATCGNVGYSKIDLYANQSVMAFVNNKMVNNRFVYYSLYIQRDGILINQNGSAQAGINVENGKNLYMPCPNLIEQKRIVNYLDRKIGEVNKIIEKAKITIEDYKKYREAIITKSVTKGLKNNVDMKSTNIEWVDKIPFAWHETRLKNKIYVRARLGWKGLKAEEYVNKGYPLLSAFNIINSKLNFEDVNYINKFRYDESPEIKLSLGDILLVKDGAGIGKCAIVEKLPTASTVNGSIALLTCDKSLNSKYLYYYFLSKIFQKYIDRLKDGMGVPHLFQRDIKMIYLAIPPIEEQNKIVKFLNIKCNEIDSLIKNKERIIIELEAYKKSLIYECVTGKKEVGSNKLLNKNISTGIKVKCKDNIFAQSILLCKIIEELSKYNLGRVKAEKALYLIEKYVGFDFSNNYVREKAGPLAEPIYKCETIISKSNKWVKVKNVNKHIEYEILPDFNKYKKYYNNYYSSYDDKIEKIIEIIKDCSTDKAEMIATLYASWNYFIIKKEKISNLKIVRDVRENWNDTKKRFDEKKWLDVLEEMKQIGLTPKGNGNLTIIKEQ